MTKICSWFDANKAGAIRFECSTVWACCYRTIPLIENVQDFSKVSVPEIIKKRKELMKNTNNGASKACLGCNLLQNSEEQKADLNKINILFLLPHTTCNLRCKYCYLKPEQLSKKIENKEKRVLPIIRNLYEQNFLTQKFELCLGGGEPFLLEDLAQTAKFMYDNFERPKLKIMSNFTLRSRILPVLDELKNLNGKMTRKIYTSIDCGTAETYKKIRGADLFNDLKKNLYDAATSGAFDILELKYLLLEDNSNLSNEDITGFLNIIKDISQNAKAKIYVVIDADYGENRVSAEENKKNSLSNKPISDDMLEAAAKIHFAATNYLNAGILWHGGRITNATIQGRSDIQRIIQASKLQNYVKE